MSAQFLTENEKEVIFNFFIKEKTPNKKQDFLALKDSIKQLPENEQEQYFQKLWGNEEGDNIVTYLFSQKNFSISNTKIKFLHSLNVDWTHTNRHGQNFIHLFYLNQKFNYSLNLSWLDSVYSNEKIDKKGLVEHDLFNKHYSYYYLDNLLDKILKVLSDHNNKDIFKNESIRILVLIDQISIPLEYYEHFSSLTIDEISFFTDKINDIYELSQRASFSSDIKLEDAKSMIQNNFNNLINMLQYHKLNMTTPINVSKSPVIKI